jgi:CelD/BcsL family acetyltransferase involved in cellulose biosynthesis
MRIETINPIAEPAWERFVSCQSEATAFYTTAWARVLNDTYGFQPRYLVSRDYDGRITGGVPLFQVDDGRLVSIPFSDVCPPLLPDASAGRALLTEAKLQAGAAAIELRGQNGLNLEAQGFQKGASFYYHLLPLGENLSTLEESFHPTVRKRIRQARKAGVTVRRAFTISDMEAFYGLMVRTRKRLGVLPQPWSFFQNIHRHCLTRGTAHLLLAEREGKIVAGGLFLSHNRTLIFKFSASDPRHSEGYPNHLVYLAAMELGIELGCRWLDMGRCELDNDGLRYFKHSWGAQELNLSYYYYPEVRAGAAVAAGSWRRQALAWFVRLVPLWVLRQAGATLYRRLA